MQNDKRTMEIQKEAWKWDNLANKLKLVGTIGIWFVIVIILSVTDSFEGPTLVIAIVVALVLMIGWRIWIAGYCAKQRDIALKALAAKQDQQDM